MSALEQSAVNPYKAPQSEQVITSEHPLREGVFGSDNPLPARWLYDHGVIELEPIAKPAAYKGKGEVTRMRAILEDRSEYLVNVGRPLHQISPVAELSTTAYLTGLEGFNFHHLLRSMEHGFYTIKVSAERQWQGNLSLARTAHNMMEIAKAFESQQSDILPNVSVLSGVSRAAMVALFVRALATPHGRAIPSMDLVAPCYPRPAAIEARTLQQPGKEAVSLVRHMLGLPLKAMIAYPKSFDTSREGLRYHAQAIPTLTDGEVGRCKDFIPVDARGTITTYSDDLMGMGNVWKEDYKHHTGVDIIDASGNGLLAFNHHLRCINHADSRVAVGRQKTLAHELGKQFVTASTIQESLAA